LPDHEQASFALVGSAEAGDLVRVPAGVAVAAEHDRQVEAMLSADGSISGKFVDRRTGEQLADAVSLYRGHPKADYVRYMERWIGESVPGATSTGIEAQDANGEFVLKGQFASSRFAQRPQPRMLIFRAGLLRHGDLRFSEKTRKYPIVLDADALRETVRIELPKEFKVDELPRPVRIDSEFGKFEATWAAEDGTLVFKRSVEMRSQTVPASRYAELRKFLDAVSGAEDSPVVLVN
jgi:hypothetical protein